MVDYSLKAAGMLKEERISSAVYNMRFIKPLDETLLDEIAARFRKVITLEENSIVGGFGSGVTEYFADKKYKCDVLRIGLPDKFIDHGTQKELHELLEIDPKGITKKTIEFVKTS